MESEWIYVLLESCEFLFFFFFKFYRGVNVNPKQITQQIQSGRILSGEKNTTFSFFMQKFCRSKSSFLRQSFVSWFFF